MVNSQFQAAGSKINELDKPNGSEQPNRPNDPNKLKKPD
jgi:hypothetical protein